MKNSVPKSQARSLDKKKRALVRLLNSSTRGGCGSLRAMRRNLLRGRSLL